MSFSDVVIVSFLSISAIFVLYNLCLFIFPAVRYKPYDRIERCEEFIYQGKYEQVFVGSGLIGGLDGRLPEGFFNLCFPYFGSCTGLEIIALSKLVPDIVFIETNYIFKGSDKELVTKVLGKRWNSFKHILPLFLKKNQPVPLARTAAGYLLKKKKQDKAHDNIRQPDEKALNRFIRIYNEPPDADGLENTLRQLEKHVNYICSEGCKIVFFEMPVHETLHHATLFELQRNRLKELFNDEKYYWIASDQRNAYQTEDGIHLTDESMTRYTHYLMQEARTLLT